MRREAPVRLEAAALPLAALEAALGVVLEAASAAAAISVAVAAAADTVNHVCGTNKTGALPGKGRLPLCF